jgi:hypothetical protein
MKAKQMRLTLAAFVGALKASEELRKLATVFDDTVGESTVAALVKKIETNWKLSGRSPGHPGELKAVLVKLEEAFDRSGAKQQTKDFSSLLLLFKGANQSIDDFVQDCRAARITTPSRRAASSGTPARGRARNLTNDEANQLARQLAKAAGVRKEFDALLARLERETTKAGLELIAEDFLGRSANGTKKQIVEALKKRQRQDELNTDRSNAQSKILP